MPKFKLPKFGSSSHKSKGDTFLLHFVRRNVCNRKAPIGDLVMPLVPAFLMIDVTQPASFVFAWTLILFLFLILWKVVPCNANLNCNHKKQKDGSKAFLMSFLIVYAILFGVAVMARIFICTDGKVHEGLLEKEGGFMDNIESLFTKIPYKETRKHEFSPSILKAQDKFFKSGGDDEGGKNNLFTRFKSNFKGI